jgi:adenylate cyclase
MQRWLSPTGWKIGLGCAALTLGLWAAGLPFFNDIELKTVDARFRLRGVQPVSGEVVIATVDQHSVDALGRWPWPRSDIAALVDALGRLGARVVALDIVFSEPERGGPGNDRSLAEAIRRAGNVVLGYFFRFGEGAPAGQAAAGADAAARRQKSEAAEGSLRERLKAVAPSRVSLVRIQGEPRLRDSCEDVEPNIPVIGGASNAMGFFSVRPDPDGVVRRIPAVFQCGDDYYSSLALRTLGLALGDPPVAIDLREDGIRSLTVGDRTLEVDEKGFLRVNFPGPARSFPYYSVIDLIRGRVPADAIRDRIVLVGRTELGLVDIVATPFHPVVPGVEVQAAAVETLLNGRFIRRNNLTILADILLVLIIGIGLGGLFHRLPGAVHRAEAFLGAAALLLGWQVISFGKLGLQFTALYPAICLALTYLGVSLYEAFGVERRSRETRRAFETYVAPAVVERIVRSPDRLVLGGERRDITVLFSDIAGFTSLSEALSPEEVVHLLNAYLTPMTDLVFHHGGTLDKYIGDAIMAIYGAPIDLPDHADRACRTALSMMDALARLKDEKWISRGWPDIKIRIGLSSGPMAVGNMGSAVRFDYTAVGDGVNLASRLEGLNKLYGTRILLSDFTRKRLKSPFIVREIDLVRVRGRQKPSRVFELRGEGAPAPEEEALIRDFEGGLAAFRERRWQAARDRFQACLARSADDGPSHAMLAKCDRMERGAPDSAWGEAAP